MSNACHLRSFEAHDLCISFEIECDILIASCRGYQTRDNSHYVDRTIADACSRHSLAKVLTDMREVDGALSPADSYREGVELGRRGFRQTMMLAWLDRPEFKKQNALYELVATNRGFQLRHFYRFDDAMKWLRGEQVNRSDNSR